MSKKKQLTGKATKLAKLPLTRVLSKKMAEAGEEPWDPLPAAVGEAEPPDPQLPFSWDDLEEGAAGLLTAAYALICREVMALHALVHDRPAAAYPEPAGAPSLTEIKQALLLTKTELQELSRIFSR